MLEGSLCLFLPALVPHLRFFPCGGINLHALGEVDAENTLIMALQTVP
jgi:hypothetical protein